MNGDEAPPEVPNWSGEKSGRAAISNRGLAKLLRHLGRRSRRSFAAGTSGLIELWPETLPPKGTFGGLKNDSWSFSRAAWLNEFTGTRGI